MSDLGLNILINVIIGIVVVVGFIGFWAKSSGAFKPGGFIYENSKNKEKKSKTNKKSNKTK